MAVNRIASGATADVTRLQGIDRATFRVAVSNWRVIFEREKGVVRALRVKHRREAYRKSTRIHQELLGQQDLPSERHPQHSSADEHGQADESGLASSVPPSESS